ncbi:MAG: hypothetical protein EZS28_021193, partial [Streblomastix strix]
MYETMEVICGLMLVGEPGTGKTTCLSTDEKYNSSRQEINKIIDNSFNSAEKYLEKFWPLGRIFGYSLKLDFVNKYKKRVRKVEVIRNDLRRMKQWMSDVKKMNISNYAGLLTIDARPLKNNRMPIPQNCGDQIKQHLHDLFAEISDQCGKDFSDLSHQLQQLPKQLNEYCDYVVFVQTIQEIHNRLKVQVELLDEMKNLGETRFSFKFSQTITSTIVKLFCLTFVHMNYDSMYLFDRISTLFIIKNAEQNSTLNVEQVYVPSSLDLRTTRNDHNVIDWGRHNLVAIALGK